MGDVVNDGLLTPPSGGAAAATASGRPLRVLERTVYRGPHFFSAIPMVRVQLDLGSLEEWPTHLIEGFTDRLLELLPGLRAHGCSYKAPGGLVRRLQDGTWLGHVVEHVALELQTLVGDKVTRGKTRSAPGRPGVYNVLYAYRDEKVGVLAGALALRLVEQLLPQPLRGLEGLGLLDHAIAADPQPLALAEAMERLRGVRRHSVYGPSTAALVEEARRRGIPVQRLDDQSLVQLGYGSRQKRFRATITGDTSHVAVETAGDKQLTKAILAGLGLPVPRGAVASTVEEAVREAARIGRPVVTKPLDGNHGRGVSTGLEGAEAVQKGYERAVQQTRRGRRVVVEEMLPGRDHRILVVGGKVVAVAERAPAAVVGDGKQSIAELIAATNRDPRRGEGHASVMTRIQIDEALRTRLQTLGLSLESVPAAGDAVQLRDTANLSTGGTAIDRTDAVHPDNAAIAEQAAVAVGLDVAGIDFLSPDISRPVRETGGGIVEVNAAPGLRMHLQPAEGRGRDVARPILRQLYPPGAASRIPVVAVTGTNGKSTTVRMVAAVFRRTGANVGMTTTSGVYFNDAQMVASDASGPKSARMVLRNPLVDIAVLETARGGILREGLGFDSCDVGAVLNVSEDHIGLKGIDTLDDLARVKSVVVESVSRRGCSVLNADDPLTPRMAAHARGRIAYFSLRGGDHMPGFLQQHVLEGGLAVVSEAIEGRDEIVVYRGQERERLMALDDIPSTLGGAAEFNVQNALAAATICIGHGLNLTAVREGLASFAITYENSPGRLNVHDGHPFRVIMDYAHNPAALMALGKLLSRLRQRHGRVIGMVSIPGDRRDEDILQMGRISAAVFDEVVFRETPDGRGRAQGAINSLLSQGALEAGMAASCIHRVLDEMAATEACLRMAEPGDIVVLLPSSVEAVWRQALAFSCVGARTGISSRLDVVSPP
jgi:cyanophycin synthetase